ncbi:23S rRNA pseudouridine(955/2504/2580) synthase RluC [Methylohalobius crimeensis]|uniref:23S rRNA pseudouridine(955/2504/2580) synthase RluC n=1 Tax=Methylohalobius crimeensis TaxID=244365 RepID=UPI0004787A8F|nr:23S rRNA pseudouridine(955/2504/2580) synthase RluC [Methylohalobius crimeensis]
MTEQAKENGPRFIEIDTHDSGQRIDNFLITRLKGMPKSRIYRLLRKGEVRVNKGRIKAHYRLRAGDRIRLPPMTLPARAREEESPEIQMMGRRLEECILYEDDELLAINKPSGMPVHGGSGLQGGVIEGLRQVRPEARFLELVHRLDKDTSGCLLIAKRKQALRELHRIFREDRVDKRYLALLNGVWRRPREMVDVSLRKFVLRGGERFVKVDREGKPSRTEFRTLERFTEATLVEARLLTGRTHQIRVHAAYLGHPILGDTRYGDEEANRRWRGKGLKRLFLHAWRLELPHPADGSRLRLEAPLDAELEYLLEALKKARS